MKLAIALILPFLYAVIVWLAVRKREVFAAKKVAAVGQDDIPTAEHDESPLPEPEKTEDTDPTAILMLEDTQPFETGNPLLWWSLAIGTLLGIGAYFWLFCAFKEPLPYVEILKWQFVVCVTMTITISDVRVELIPDKLLLVLLCGIPVFRLLEIFMERMAVKPVILDMLFGLLLGGGMLALVALLTKGGVGAGDVKLFAVLGLLLGLRKIMSVLLIMCISSALTSVVLLITKKKTFKDRIPMAPFIMTGIILSVILSV